MSATIHLYHPCIKEVNDDDCISGRSFVCITFEDQGSYSHVWLTKNGYKDLLDKLLEFTPKEPAI